MRPQQYKVTLTSEDRSRLEKFISSGQAPAAEMAHARVLLKADQGPDGPRWTDAQISDALDVSTATVARVRRRYVENGLDAALKRAPTTRVYERKLDGVQEAHLIALTCSEPPAGQNRWSLRLLADKLVELKHVDDVSYGTVRRVLQKTNSSRG